MILRDIVLPAALVAAFFVSGCAQVRNTVDIGLAAISEKNTQALVEADIERKRLRAFRCHNPMLTLDAAARAAEDPQLGQPWIEELFRDCPRFRDFLAGQAVRRLSGGG